MGLNLACQPKSSEISKILTVVVSLSCVRVECDWELINVMSSIATGTPSFSYVTVRVSVLTMGTFVVAMGVSSISGSYFLLSVTTVGGCKHNIGSPCKHNPYPDEFLSTDFVTPSSYNKKNLPLNSRCFLFKIHYYLYQKILVLFFHHKIDIYWSPFSGSPRILVWI